MKVKISKIAYQLECHLLPRVEEETLQHISMGFVTWVVTYNLGFATSQIVKPGFSDLACYLQLGFCN
jgi:hypothetical protein